MHMHDLQLKGELIAQGEQCMQQDDRIESARQRQRQPGVRGNLAGKAARHDIDYRLIWQEFP